MVGVNQESPKTAAAFMRKHGYMFPTLADTLGEVGKSYTVVSIPTVVIIDKNGKIDSHLVGTKGEADLPAALKKVGVE